MTQFTNKAAPSRRSVLTSAARIALWSTAFSPLAKGFLSTALAAEPKPWFLLYNVGGGTMLRCKPCIGNGANYELSEYYSPLEAIKQDITFIQGVSNKVYIDWLGGDDGGHDAGATGLCGRTPLSGEGAKPGEKVIKLLGGPTIDRVFAAALSEGLPLPSVDFGVGNDFGQAVTRVLSWRGPGQAVSQWKEPRLAFSRLFGGAISRTGIDTSTEEKLDDLVLDNVASQLGATRDLLGAQAKKTMEANLDALSEFRLNAKRLSAKLKDLKVDSNFIKPPVDATGKPLPTTDSRAFPELLKQFNELAAICLDLGLTRVVTYQLGDSHGTNFTFPFLNGRDGLTFMGDMHFTYGHEFFDRQAHRLVIERWLNETFVDLASRLKKNQTANFSTGFATLMHQMEHSPHHRVGMLPAVLAGNPMGKLKAGTLVNLVKERIGGGDFLPEYNLSGTRSTNELFLTLAKALNIKLDVFGEPKYCQNGVISGVLA
jgi:hypothetical protein